MWLCLHSLLSGEVKVLTRSFHAVDLWHLSLPHLSLGLVEGGAELRWGSVRWDAAGCAPAVLWAR